MELRTTFQKAIIWKIGDGNKISMWNDNWVTDTPLIEQGTQQQGTDINGKVSSYLNSDKSWNIQKLEQNFPCDVVNKILNTYVP